MKYQITTNGIVNVKRNNTLVVLLNVILFFSASLEKSMNKTITIAKAIIELVDCILITP